MSIIKKSYRSPAIITRTSDELDQSSIAPSWLSEFANNLGKSAVQPYRKEESHSLYDQINEVMNGSKSKFRNVEEIVDSMKERSGLKAYRNKIEAQKNDVQKMAEQISAVGKEDDIKLFSLNPNIKNTIDNFIMDTHGNLPIPSIIERVKSIHHRDIADDGAWDDDNLFKYINNKSIEVKKSYPDMDKDNLNLGKVQRFNENEIDPSNGDALFSLNPAVIK